MNLEDAIKEIRRRMRVLTVVIIAYGILAITPSLFVAYKYASIQSEIADLRSRFFVGMTELEFNRQNGIPF